MPLALWKSFQEIERDFAECVKPIGFTAAYYKVHSPQLSRVIQRSMADMGDMAMRLNAALDPASRPRDARAALKALATRLPDFARTRITVPSLVMTLTPWKDLEAGSPPQWWAECLKVANDPTAHFLGANYWNAIHAVSALAVEIHHYELVGQNAQEAQAKDGPRIFLPRRA